ncbi:MAG TPA: cytochrome P450 [Pirellulales bacterium]|nr:cytochrome P450 [Pirellulales bacterium]
MAVAPGFRHRIPLPYGPLAAFLRDPLGFQMQARERFGDVVRFHVGPVVTHFLYHPAHVRRVLHENHKNYPRGWHYGLMRRAFGESLTVSEGDFWLRQRRLAQPAFHRQRLSGYAEVMVDSASQLVSRWRAMASESKPVEARHEMSRATLAVTSRTLFARDVSHEADEVGQAFLALGRYFEYRFRHPVAPPTWVPTPVNRRFTKAVSTMKQVVAEIVRERIRDGKDHGDLMSMLIQARDDETGDKMTDDQVRSEVLNFLLAGYETTATALTWTWYLLASHEAVRQRVREEVRTVIGDRLPTAADAPLLPLTRAVIQEAMRLYPPIWIIPRLALKNDEIDGFRIPRRSTVALCPYVTHRHPAFWDAPESFDPDRFTAERTAARPKEAYFPFLSGPHHCIGNEFAMLEMQLVVARVLQEFDVTLLSDQAVKPAASLGLWPDRPVWLTLHSQERRIEAV